MEQFRKSIIYHSIDKYVIRYISKVRSDILFENVINSLIPATNIKL